MHVKSSFRLVISIALLGTLWAGCDSADNAKDPGSASSSDPNDSAGHATASRGASTVPALLGQARGWLAYQTLDGSDDRVRLVRVDGTGNHAIGAELPGRTAHPDFSVDGRHLVIDQLDPESGADQVYIGDSNGGRLRLLAPCRPPRCLGHWEAAWSPDGRRLAISTGGGPLTATGPSRFGISIIEIGTERVTPVVDHPSGQGQDHFARWSPDGSQLVFWRERPAPDGSLQTAVFRVDVTGEHLQQLTPWSMSAGDPDWSPTGSAIVFSTHPLLTDQGEAHSELFLMRPDGTGLRQITRNGDGGPRATQPRWTPDGRAILYVHTESSGFPRHVYVIAPDGTHDEPVLTDGLFTHPDIEPTR